MLELWTDGGCQPNPGLGGWGYVLFDGDVEVCRGSGFLGHSTNQRAEITAAIEGLAAIITPAELTLYTDSMYLVQTMLGRWQRRANLDLWDRLDRARRPHRVHPRHVKGHSGLERNDIADQLATNAILLRV